MLEAAVVAAARAYAPYSGFKVGAAVLTGEGTVYAGCNVENASYGLTICAERNAVFQMVAASPRPIALRGILVYTPTTAPTAPCGACRQVLHEFGPVCDVLCVCDGPERIATTLDQLLPGAFDLGRPG
jgi:cytidine deaminase